MKNQWRFWLSFIVIVLVVLFSVFNTEEVAVNFGVIQMRQPLVLVIVGSFFIGAFVMFLLFFSSYWKRGKKIKSLEQELAEKNDVTHSVGDQFEDPDVNSQTGPLEIPDVHEFSATSSNEEILEEPTTKSRSKN